jgi:hypothetical protein
VKRVCLGVLEPTISPDSQVWIESISRKDIKERIEQCATSALPLFRAIDKRNLEGSAGWARVVAKWPKLAPIYLVAVPKSFYIDHFGGQVGMALSRARGFIREDQFCPFLEIAGAYALTLRPLPGKPLPKSLEDTKLALAPFVPDKCDLVTDLYCGPDYDVVAFLLRPTRN